MENPLARMRLIRRRYGATLCKQWPGRCRTTVIALAGPDPQVKMVEGMLTNWFDVLLHRDDVRKELKEAWAIIRRGAAARDPATRWKQHRT
eukprot:1351782-Prorocentrum_lima.AAC.1